MKEQFDHGDDVCGAAVSVTDTQEEISLWTKNAANEAVQVIAFWIRYINKIPITNLKFHYPCCSMVITDLQAISAYAFLFFLKSCFSALKQFFS